MKIRYCSSGVHLFHRETGWNLLLDEIRTPRPKWAVAPRQVSIALTNACDLTCDYCFAPKTRSALPFDRVISWLSELDTHGTLGVGFGGGEPTLYPRFVELCVHATHHTALAVTFTTHGHHLHDRLLEQLDGHIHFVRVSMDGVGATYERLRRRSFRMLLERLAALRQVSRFGINYVVNLDTFSDLDRAVRLAEETEASEFLLLPERPARGRPGATYDLIGRLRKWVTNYRGSVPLSTSIASSEGLPTCDPFASEAPLEGYAHIDASGTLKITSFDKTGIPIVGSFISALSQLHHLQHLN